jgi:hypothetical protein
MSTTPPLDHAPPRSRRSGALAFFLGGSVVAALMTFALVLGGRQVIFGSINARLVDEGGVELALARRAAELRAVATIPDAELNAIVETMRAKAAAGDTRAALFVLETAKLQRSK